MADVITATSLLAVNDDEILKELDKWLQTGGKCCDTCQTFEFFSDYHKRKESKVGCAGQCRNCENAVVRESIKSILETRLPRCGLMK